MRNCMQALIHVSLFTENTVLKGSVIQPAEENIKEREANMIKNTFDDPVSLVKLPFIHGTIGKIAHILKKHKVLATFNPLSQSKAPLGLLRTQSTLKTLKGFIQSLALVDRLHWGNWSFH